MIFQLTLSFKFSQREKFNMEKIIFINLIIFVFSGFVKNYKDDIPNILIPEIVNVTSELEQVTTQVIYYSVHYYTLRVTWICQKWNYQNSASSLVLYSCIFWNKSSFFH